jgi:tetratricopeptide (TPR) repeat protein
MGDWASWRDLSPLVDVAKNHAPKSTVVALNEASALLKQGKAKSADARLAKEASTTGRRWVAVARADLAALHFTVCIRGVAWRLTDGESPEATEREMDFSEETRVESGDISVEALLTNLEEALTDENQALVTQARIARARVAAFSQRCAANEDVAQLAQRTVESDLATLAAEGHLTPDLAYMWAGVQMNRFSGTAARPFLLQAREGGFEHPAVVFMLAVISLEERKLDEADQLAAQAIEIYQQLDDPQNTAEAYFIRGEVAMAANKPKLARKHYEAALKLSPLHVPSMLAIATQMFAAEQETEAVDYLHAKLPAFTLKGKLDDEKARTVATNLEALVVMATEPVMAQLSRDALLQAIDREQDPMRRGLRYFYAATLEVRLREYEMAKGHGVLAKEEFAESTVASPIDVEAFLRRLEGG